MGIALIALLTGFATTGRVDPAELLLTVGRLIVGLLVLPGLWIVPRLLSVIAPGRVGGKAEEKDRGGD